MRKMYTCYAEPLIQQKCVSSEKQCEKQNKSVRNKSVRKQKREKQKCFQREKQKRKVILK